MSLALFIVGVIILLLFALGLVLPTLLLPNKQPWQLLAEKERAENIKVGKERLKELQVLLAAKEISPTEAQAQQLEIEKNLLQEVTVSETEAGGKIATPQKQKADWAMSFFITLTLFIFTPLVYLSVGTPNTITASNSTAPATPTADADVNQIMANVQKLKQHLEENPNDVPALFLMGQLNAIRGDLPKAAQLYERAYKLDDNNPEIHAAYLDALMQIGSNGDKINELITTGISKYPTNALILWLAGIHAENQGDIKTAIQYWRRAEQHLQDAPQAKQELQLVIQDALFKLNEQADPTPDEQ